MMGQEWKKLGPEERGYWDKQANDEKAMFRQQFEEFRSKLEGDDNGCLDMLEAEHELSEDDGEVGPGVGDEQLVGRLYKQFEENIK